MHAELKVGLGLSVGLHAAAFIGWPSAMTPAVFDVERAPTSLEIVLVAPKPSAVVVQPKPPVPSVPPEPVETIPDAERPTPETVVVPEQRGALTKVLPSYLKNPPPRYPWRARQEGYEGTVLLDVEVLPSGRCGRLRIARSSGHVILDEAARSAIASWHFQPARRGTQPVAVWVEIPITFRLVEGGE